MTIKQLETLIDAFEDYEWRVKGEKRNNDEKIEIMQRELDKRRIKIAFQESNGASQQSMPKEQTDD